MSKPRNLKLEKDGTLTIRISHQAKEVIRQRAATEGKTLTEYITTLLLKGIDVGEEYLSMTHFSKQNKPT